MADALFHQFGENFSGIDAKDAGQVDEFDDIHTALAAFDPGDRGLRGLQARRELRLREFGCFSGREQRRAERSVTARSKGLQCGCSPLVRARTYNAKSELCYF
jgi:hypothetical protein